MTVPGEPTPAEPPSKWFPGCVQVGDDGPYIALGPSPAETIVWHWCEGRQPAPAWEGAYISNHTIVQREPLTITASLACRSCPWHGFITDGRWRAV